MDAASGWPGEGRDARDWAGGIGAGRMAALALPVLLITFNDTAFNVSLPSLMGRLGADEGGVAWLVSVYILASTVLMPVAGQAGDALGKRRVYLFGIAAFGAGSVACAAAATYWALLLGRALQGLGGAAIVPVSLSLLADAVPVAGRGRALGTWEAATPAGAVLGPLVGGALLEWTGFSMTLALAAVLAAASLFLAARYVRPRPAPAAEPARGGPRADVLGGLLLTAMLVCLLLLAGGVARGPAVACALAAGGVLAGVALVAWEKRAPSPFLPLQVISGPPFIFAMVGAFSLMFIGFGSTIASPLFLGSVLGLAPLAVGVALLPRAIGQLLSTPLGGRLVSRVGHRLPAVVGMALSAASLLVAAAGALMLSLPIFVCGLTGFGFARGLCPAAYSAAATMALTSRDSGAGSGFYELARYSGALFGSAAFGTAIGAIAATRWANGSPALTYGAVFAIAGALAVLGAIAGLGLPGLPGGRARRLAAGPAARPIAGPIVGGEGR